MVNMQQVAEHAGVSRATVSRVLANHPSVTAATRQKVLYWVDKLGYQPNLVAQSLAGNRSNILAVVVPEIAYPFFSEILESIESQAFYAGYSTLICNTCRSLEKEKNILNKLRQRQVDGVIAVPVSVEESPAAYHKLNIPTVMITKRVEGFCSIYISHYEGGAQIAKHFLSLGFQRIGYIGPIQQSTSALKYEGLRDYLQENRVKLTDVIECKAPANMNANQVFANVKRYATEHGIRAEAFLANDDITACEAVAAFRELGLSVPQDVAISGFDNSLLAKEMNPKLTSVAQPLQEIAQKAVDVLLEQIREPSPARMYEMPSRVAARESTLCWKE